GYAHLEQPLTRNVLGIYRALNAIEIAYPSYTGSAPPLGGITSGPGTIAPPYEGTTAIWDSIVVTCRNVLGRSFTQRRRAIILLTDGLDTSSRVPRSSAIEQAIQTDTVVYAIGIGDKHHEGINKRALNEIAGQTG